MSHYHKYLVELNTNDRILFLFWCPACHRHHSYDSRWSFNGDHDKPSFSPSLRVLDGNGGTACHLYITDGKIDYCPDNPHDYNGRHGIDMVEVSKVQEYMN